MTSMTRKVIIVYESLYGNTRIVAETIIGGMQGVEAVLKELREVDINRMAEYDLIVIGSPNHYGGPTKGIRDFIDRLKSLNPDGKYFAVFDTYLGKGFHEKAVKRMEKRISETLPGLRKIAPALSIAVQGSKGPIAEAELPRCKEFGKTIAAELASKAAP